MPGTGETGIGERYKPIFAELFSMETYKGSSRQEQIKLITLGGQGDSRKAFYTLVIGCLLFNLLVSICLFSRFSSEHSLLLNVACMWLLSSPQSAAFLFREFPNQSHILFKFKRIWWLQEFGTLKPTPHTSWKIMAPEK